ncbi:MAG TPA: allantoinase AllB [Planktothrix sp.]|jgi:allantoinase
MRQYLLNKSHLAAMDLVESAHVRVLSRGEDIVSKTLAIKSKRLVTPEGIKEGCLLIKDGIVQEIARIDAAPGGWEVVDAGDSVVMPGLVDSHVHLNEPGRTEWEGFETGSRAAAAGGITTIADMPLNSNPVTTTLDALEQKLEAASKKLHVDCAFYGGVIPGNASSLEPLIQAGVRGFKCFLIHSGIDDFPNVTEEDLNLAMPILARHNMPLLVHAELECADSHPPEWGDRCDSYEAFLHSRPRRWENDAIDMMIALSRKHKCPVHIVHLSSSDAIPAIKKARAEGLQFTVETCPHYLTFAAEEIEDGDPRFKCAPPIREKENREKLWQAVMDGTIDFVVSDHSPCTPALKFLQEGNLQKAWGGISSLQFVLPAVWTQAQKHGATIFDIARKVSAEPAKFLGLSGKKGTFAKGADGDVVIWNPEQPTKIHSEMIEHRHKVTPYDGRQLMGRIEKTFVRGNLVFNDGVVTPQPTGQMLLRERVESKK